MGNCKASRENVDSNSVEQDLTSATVLRCNQIRHVDEIVKKHVVFNMLSMPLKRFCSLEHLLLCAVFISARDKRRRSYS